MLFGRDGFRVVPVQVAEHEGRNGAREVVVEGVEDEQACPLCEVVAPAVHSRRLRRVKDLPHGADCCGCGGTSAAGRAGSGGVGGGRSPNGRCRSSRVGG